MNRSLVALLAVSAAPLAFLTQPVGAVQPPPPVPATPVSRPATGLAKPSTTATPKAGATVSTKPSAAPLPQAGNAAATPVTAAATSTRQILLQLGKREISLLEDGKVVGSWPVAVGDPATPTPTGQFKVRNKVINPQYQSTKSGKVNPTLGAQGPLGDRWIGFHATEKDQFGIHGTPSAWAWTVTSRAAVSHGCVRMLTPHVRQLFDQVEVGTPVVVKP
jgi:lipoprotein-anchoring transpeptidase ErfK/SrfK